MRAFLFVLFVMFVGAAGAHAGGDDREATAERFFRGVYGGDAAVVQDLAAEDVFLRYPIFEKLFGSPEISGRDAVRQFAEGFGNRWVDAHISIEEVVAEGDRVVLLWTFSARNVGSARADVAPTNEVHTWGGLTLYRFNADGKIAAEIGYESVPAPAAKSE